jgi:predicted RNase H-like HicB family nuclease
MSKVEFVVQLFEDPEVGGFVADVVNLPGCMSQGETKEEALDNIEKAIKAYLEVVGEPQLGEKPTLITKKSIEVPQLVN